MTTHNPISQTQQPSPSASPYLCRQRQRNVDSESGEKGEKDEKENYKIINSQIFLPGSLLDNAQAHPIIVPMSSINQSSDSQPKLLVWPPNSLLSDVNNIALNVFASESYNNLASIGSVKGRKSKTFGGCDPMGNQKADDLVHPVTISTLSL